MKKRVLSLLLVGAMTASMVAGCGSKSDETTTGSGTDTNAGGTASGTEAGDTDTDTDTAKASDKPVTLKTVSMFGGTDPNKKAYDAINEAFKAENPNVTLEDNSQTSDEEWKAAVNTDFSVGNEPDVLFYFTDATADTIVKTDKLVTLDEIRAEYPDYGKDIYDSMIEGAKNKDGVARALPLNSYWEGLFCNKTLFEENNIEIPTDWASLETAIKEFAKTDIVPIACSLNNVPHYWIEHLMLYTAGADEYTSVPETAPEGWQKGLDMFKTLREMNAFPKDTDTADDATTGSLFRSGKAAMQLDGSWYAGQVTDSDVKDDVIVVAFPGVPDQKADPNTMVGGVSSGFYITRKAWDDPDKRDAAVKLVMAHTSKDAIQQYWEASGCITKASADVTPVELDDPMAKSISELTSAAKVVCAPTDARIGDAYKTLVSEIVKVSTGAMTSEDAINEALALVVK